MESTEESVVRIDVQQYLLILRRRWLPATVVFALAVALAALNAGLQKPVYEARGRLLIKTPNNVTSAMGSTGSESLKQIGELSSIGESSDPLKTEVELIRSTPILEKTIAILNPTSNPNIPRKPENLRGGLVVKNIEATDILEVSYQNPDPKIAAGAVNQVMNLYLESNIFANRTEAATAREFIAKQLPKTEANVSQAEMALRKFKEENNIIALDEEEKSAVAIIQDLETQVDQGQAELAAAIARSEVLRNKLRMTSQQGVAASSLSQAPGVQKALEELQQVESQLAVEQSRYEEAHPVIVELRGQRAALEAQLEGRVEQVLGGEQQDLNRNLQVGELKPKLTEELIESEAGRLSLAKKVSALANTLAAYRQRENTLPSLEQRQRELERELTAAQSTYETLLRRLEEIRVEENRVVGNARIVEEAKAPVEPMPLNKANNLAVGGLLGILLAIVAALSLEALDKSIKTVKEARELFGYTLLGVIPSFGKSRKPTSKDRDLEEFVPKIVVRDNPRSFISEAYRMLQANLSFLGSDKELKVIVITSSVPQEGKSAVSANLATAIAQSGQKVLLVDADMRRPIQHQIWDQLNETGLSNVVVGQAELRGSIKEVMANLYVLTAGVTPPNPAALLNSKRMATLVEKFSDSYDSVIIDTPSLSVAADASILGKIADGVLLLVRPDVVDSASAGAAKELLAQSGQNVLGLVVNGVIPENEPHSYYHYAEEYDRQEGSIVCEKVVSKINKAGRS